MARENEERSLAAARRAMGSRLGQEVKIESFPERDERNVKAVEQVWRSGNRSFAVEHTQIEAFPKQIEDSHRFEQLLGPVERALSGHVPGRFSLRIPVGSASGKEIDELAVQRTIVEWVVRVAPAMPDEAVEILQDDSVPFEVRLFKRHSNDARVMVGRSIFGSVEPAREERIRTALDEKLPKLSKAGDAHAKVLVTESDDIGLSNVFAIAQAFRAAAQGRDDLPEFVFLFESDAFPLTVWTLKNEDSLLPREESYEDWGAHGGDG